MTVLDDAITEQKREVPVIASQLCDFLMRVRAAGGFVNAMDVGGSKYTVHIIWLDKPKEKQEELL